MQLTIDLTDQQVQQLSDRAASLDQTPEAVAQEAVVAFLTEAIDNGNRSFFPLGAPLRQKYKQPYQLALNARFTDKKAGVDYLHRILDRQINKARGLLTYNALLFTAINATIVARASPNNPPVFPSSSRLGLCLALASCVPLLLMFYLSWGTAQSISSAASDFATTLVFIRRRTYLLTLSLYATFAATLITLWLVVNW